MNTTNQTLVMDVDEVKDHLNTCSLELAKHMTQKFEEIRKIHSLDFSEDFYILRQKIPQIPDIYNCSVLFTKKDRLLFFQQAHQQNILILKEYFYHTTTPSHLKNNLIGLSEHNLWEEELLKGLALGEKKIKIKDKSYAIRVNKIQTLLGPRAETKPSPFDLNNACGNLKDFEALRHVLFDCLMASVKKSLTPLIDMAQQASLLVEEEPVFIKPSSENSEPMEEGRASNGVAVSPKP